MLKSLLVLACLGVALSAGANIIDLANSLGATTLLGYLNATGLTGALAGTGPFTVFAPSNAAFGALPANVKDALSKNPDLLRQVLLYHVTNGTALSSQLTNEQLVPSLVSNEAIRINIYELPTLSFPIALLGKKKVITASGSKVIMADQRASNGVIHVVDRVMFPLPTGSIPQYVAGQADLGTLIYLVTQTTLTSALASRGPFTLFAPVNPAFDKLRPGALSDLLVDLPKLQAVLKYHVIQGTHYSKGLTSGTLTTLEGKTVSITVGEGVTVNGAKVLMADQTVQNGVVHKIDTVLIPSDL